MGFRGGTGGQHAQYRDDAYALTDNTTETPGDTARITAHYYTCRAHTTPAMPLEATLHLPYSDQKQDRSHKRDFDSHKRAKTTVTSEAPTNYEYPPKKTGGFTEW